MSIKPAMYDELDEAVRALKKSFWIIGFFSFFINLLMLVAPLYMLQLYDRVLASGSVPTLYALTGFAVGLLIILGVLEFIRSRILVRLGNRLDSHLSERIFTATFERNLMASSIDRGQALRDLESLRQFLAGTGPLALFDAPWTPVFLVVIFLFHPILGFIALAASVVLFSLALLNELRTRAPLSNANLHAADATAFAQSSLRNADAIRAMGMMPALRARWYERHKASRAYQSVASDRGGTISALSKTARLIVQVAMLGTGAFLAIDQIITPGVMIAASIIMSRALQPIEQAIGNWRAVVSARHAYGRIKDLLDSLPSGPEPMPLPEPHGEISIRRLVGFPPGAEQPAIKRISFDLEAGDSVGVIGPTGAGKSTLARLLVGVWAAR